MRQVWSTLWLSTLLVSTNVLPTVLAVPHDLDVRVLNARDGAKDPMIKELDKLTELFGAYEGSYIDPDIKPDDLKAKLSERLKKKSAGLKRPLKNRKLRVFFIEFCGTTGDVQKGEYYLDALAREGACTQLERFLDIFKNDKLYSLRFAIDCAAVNYLSDATKQKYKKDIESCGTDRTATRDRIKKLMDIHKPDAIIRGNAVERLYNKDKIPDAVKFWADVSGFIDKRVTDDQSFVMDIKSYVKLPWEIKRPREYMITPKRVTLTGQTPDWYADIDILQDMRQVMVGRAPSPAQGPLNDKLKAWIESKKNVMYMGEGGNKRPNEKDIDKPTPVYGEFVEKVLKMDEYKDWNFLVFHNWKRDDEDKIDPITDDGRVYHIWYGKPFMTMWGMEQIKIVSHHCGKGSFDDAIITGKAQLCVPQLGFGKDMKYWAKQLGKYNIGRDAPPIEFSDGAEPEATYKGIMVEYTGMDKMIQAFKECVEEGDKMRENTKAKKDVLLADTAGELTVRAVNMMGLGIIERKIAKKPLADRVEDIKDIIKDPDETTQPEVPPEVEEDTSRPASLPSEEATSRDEDEIYDETEDDQQSSEDGSPDSSDNNPDSSDPGSEPESPPNENVPDNDGPLNPLVPSGGLTPNDEFDLPGFGKERREDASGWEF